jgi:hypothetical protein
MITKNLGSTGQAEMRPEETVKNKPYESSMEHDSEDEEGGFPRAYRNSQNRLIMETVILMQPIIGYILLPAPVVFFLIAASVFAMIKLAS